MRSRAFAGIVALLLLFVQFLAAVPAYAENCGATETKFAFVDQGPGLNDFNFRWIDNDPAIPWINDERPNVAFQSVLASDCGGVDGFAYTVDRARGTVPFMPAVGSTMAYAPADWATGSGAMPLAAATLDMRGWFAVQSAPYFISGMHDDVEGVWYVHARSVNATSGVLGKSKDFTFGLDVTAPRAVTNLRFSDDRGMVVPFSRRDILWDNGVQMGAPYDDLSGDSRFVVYLNGKPLRTARLVQSARYMGTSIESLSPGKNVIEVSCMDAAGNEGPTREVVTYSDPDTPTIEITSPKAGQTVGQLVQFSVATTDSAGISGVRYEVDGVHVGTSTKAPFGLKANLSGFSEGLHVVSAFATDLFGRTVEAKQIFRLDPTPPSITGVSAGPSPFYPIIKDGFRDFTTFKFRLSEKANVRFEVRTTKGTRVYSASASRKAGANSFKWSGQGLTGTNSNVLFADFYLRVIATDAAGNKTTSARVKVRARTYEVIKTAPNAAHVIPR